MCYHPRSLTTVQLPPSQLVNWFTRLRGQDRFSAHHRLLGVGGTFCEGNIRSST
jgi:hypothetical protein